MKTRRRNTDSNPNPYFEAFYAELSERVALNGVRDVDDIVQLEGERVLQKLDRLVVRYPDPVIYARLRAKPAIVDYLRREKSQRGEGCRARRDDRGRLVKGRSVVSGDSRVDDEEDSPRLFDVIADQRATQHDAADLAETREMLERALLAVSPNEATVLYLAHGLQFRDGEIAEWLGVTRETVNRKKRGAVRRIRGGLGPGKV